MFITKTLLLKKRGFGSLQKEVDGLFTNKNDANDIINSRGVSNIVKRKACHEKLKPTIVAKQTLLGFQMRFRRIISFRCILSSLDVNVCAFYSTDTSNTSLTIALLLGKIVGDLRNPLFIPTGNRVNEGAKNMKNKDFIFTSICSAGNLKSAYYQIKSN